MRNLKAFLAGFLFIAVVAVTPEVFAADLWLPASANQCTKTRDVWADSKADFPALTHYCTSGGQSPDKYDSMSGVSSHGNMTVTINGVNYTGPRYSVIVYYVGASNPTVTWVDLSGKGARPPACGTDTIPGKDINGGFGSGIYNVNECAYSCGTNYSLLDGNTSLADAQECTGLGESYSTPEPDDYQGSPQQCVIRAGTGECMDMDKQENGACPVGTTYGRVNDQEVCVKSGDSKDPLDPKSEGLEDKGGNMQAEGTPDRAGTGGQDTGSGTSTGSSSSSSTTECTTTESGESCTTTETGTSETETNGPPTFGGHGDPASWWKSNYPEGAGGIAAKFSQDMGNGPFMAMLNPLKSLPSSGSEPSWTWNMNMGPLGDYTGTLELPPGVWLFIRVCILFTAAMTVRKLIFGG